MEKEVAKELLKSELRGRSHPHIHAFVDLVITEGNVQWHNDRHAAVRPVRSRSHMHTSSEEATVSLDDIFKLPPLPFPEESAARLRTVLTKAPAGAGKTVSVHRFVQNWAKGLANRDVDFIFLLPFRELNMVAGQSFSLIGLIRHFHPSLASHPFLDLSQSRVIFILDGLDQWLLPLEFDQVEVDVTKKIPLPTLLSCLVWGPILPSARIWVTSRPPASSLLPPDLLPQHCLRCVTQIRGLSHTQKESYFLERLAEHRLAEEALARITSSPDLGFLCQAPQCCEMVAAILESEKTGKGRGWGGMDTLTMLHTQYMLSKTGKRGYLNPERSHSNRNILQLGKLSFSLQESGKFVFRQTDLFEHGINACEGSVFRELCQPLEVGLQNDGGVCMYSFIYTSIQEYLAALYVFHMFRRYKRNELLQPTLLDKLIRPFKKATLFNLHKTAVDKVLNYKHGRYDLFLRFLLGLSVTSHQGLLDLGSRFMAEEKVKSFSRDVEKTVHYIREVLGQEPYPQTALSLLCGLAELREPSLGMEVRQYLEVCSRWGFILEPEESLAFKHLLRVSKQGEEEDGEYEEGEE